MKKEVVILVIAHKAILDEHEIVSLKQLYKILGKHPIKFICPEGLNISKYKEIIDNPEFDFIDPWWQSTYANFNKLKISPLLYKKYKNYKYILFYEPDAYVFRDDLLYWCAKGYDYIGAPWFDGWSKANENSKFMGVGNGGFSLRKIDSALAIWKWYNFYKIRKPNSILVEEFKARNNELSWFKKLGSLKYLIFQILGKNNNTLFHIDHWYENEDVFWVKYIPTYFPKLKVAPYNEAYAFSFEVNASMLYKKNNNQLPFGCHAWQKYEYEKFWKKHIS